MTPPGPAEMTGFISAPCVVGGCGHAMPCPWHRPGARRVYRPADEALRARGMSVPFVDPDGPEVRVWLTWEQIDHCHEHAEQRAQIGASTNRGAGTHDRWPYYLGNLVEVAARTAAGLSWRLTTRARHQVRDDAEVAVRRRDVDTKYRGDFGALVATWKANQHPDRYFLVGVIEQRIKPVMRLLGAVTGAEIVRRGRHPAALPRAGTESDNYVIDPPWEISASDLLLDPAEREA